MSGSQTLKACPCCSGPPVKVAMDAIFNRPVVKCTSCGLIAPGDAVQTAEFVWNRRVPGPAPVAPGGFARIGRAIKALHDEWVAQGAPGASG